MKGFYVLTESYYFSPSVLGKNITEQIMIGDYDPDGGTSGEFSIRWFLLSGPTISPKIEMFNDSWQLLREYAWFFDALSLVSSGQMDGVDVSPGEIITILKAHGFKDLTQRKSKDFNNQGGEHY